MAEQGGYVGVTMQMKAGTAGSAAAAVVVPITWEPVVAVDILEGVAAIVHPPMEEEEEEAPLALAPTKSILAESTKTTEG